MRHTTVQSPRQQLQPTRVARAAAGQLSSDWNYLAGNLTRNVSYRTYHRHRTHTQYNIYTQPYYTTQFHYCTSKEFRMLK